MKQRSRPARTPGEVLEKVLDPTQIGFTRIELHMIGVAWPPRKGWRSAVIKSMGPGAFKRYRAQVRELAKAKRRAQKDRQRLESINRQLDLGLLDEAAEHPKL